MVDVAMVGAGQTKFGNHPLGLKGMWAEAIQKAIHSVDNGFDSTNVEEAFIGHGILKQRRLLNPVFCRHTHEGQILGHGMVRRIIIKFGGALITKKDEECVANIEIIRNLCSTVHSITQQHVPIPIR